ncbi:hypothetical protein F2S72_09185 [Pseudomonas syringae pv. actinidiae]|nr:hypothetical protein [Pseudomonas syringae pv. actinidiae]
MHPKRYRFDDPAIKGCDVVLVSDLEGSQRGPSNARPDSQATPLTFPAQIQRIAELEADLASVRDLSVALDSDVSLERRMVAAGMYRVAELHAGRPIDAFVRHAGVHDLDSFNSWLERKRAEFVKLQARFELANREDDELYEWVMSNAAAYSEVAINFKTVYQQIRQTSDGDAPGCPPTPTALH